MPSFDVVSEVDIQEVKNAINQASKEVETRYDFRGSSSKIEFNEKESEIVLDTTDEMKVGAMRDLLSQKLSKRGVSLKSCEFGPPEKAGGDRVKLRIKIKQGLSDDELKKVNKSIKNTKVKVNAQIQGNQIRVTGKKRDDLQEIIAHLKSDMDSLSLQFINFRD